MTDEEFRRLAWRTVIDRAESLTLALRAACKLPMVEADALAVRGALSNLDETRVWFESVTPHRLVLTGCRRTGPCSPLPAKQGLCPLDRVTRLTCAIASAD